MYPTFGHPLWISSGLIMMFVGFVLFRWARSIDVPDAGRQAALEKLLKGGKTESKGRAANNFRRAMSQLFGIVGFLTIIAGLMALLLGLFYPVG